MKHVSWELVKRQDIIFYEDVAQLENWQKLSPDITPSGYHLSWPLWSSLNEKRLLGKLQKAI